MFSPKVDVCQLNLPGYFGLENNDFGCFKLCGFFLCLSNI